MLLHFLIFFFSPETSTSTSFVAFLLNVPFLLAQIINDNMMYAKVVVRMGVRTECKNCDFSDILEDEDVRTLNV